TSRHSKATVEDDPQQGALPIDTAGSQKRVVDKYRSHPDADSVHLGTDAVCMPVGSLRRQQGAVAGPGGEIAVQADRSLQGHKRPARFEQGEKRLVLPPG